MNLPQMWPGLSNEGLRKPSGNVLFVNVSVVDSVARPFLLVNATSRHVHGQFRVTNAHHDCNASLAERCDGCGAPASLKERDIAVSFTCKHDDDVVSAQRPPPTSKRRVNWFNAGGEWTVGQDGLDLAGWLAAHGPASKAPAITGTMPCCGCWNVTANGRVGADTHLT